MVILFIGSNPIVILAVSIFSVPKSLFNIVKRVSILAGILIESLIASIGQFPNSNWISYSSRAKNQLLIVF